MCQCVFVDFDVGEFLLQCNSKYRYTYTWVVDSNNIAQSRRARGQSYNTMWPHWKRDKLCMLSSHLATKHSIISSENA